MTQKANLKIWWMAVRPKTLMAAISPVFIATAMAFGDGVYHLPTAILCLVGAISIQIGTNLANDYFDFKNGADTEDRVGPTRVTQAGLISPGVVKWSFIFVFAITMLICALLVTRGGWPVIVLGVIAILSGIFYTAGSKPLGYIGLGDIFVFVFFGPVAVGYTYYLQSFEMNIAVILAGIAPGLISVAILAINNLRDYDTDQKSNKRTMVVRFGKIFGYYEYLFSIILAALMPTLIYLLIDDHKYILLSSLLIILSVPTFLQLLRIEDMRQLNPLLGKTGKLLMIYSVLFSIGWIL